MTPTSFGRATAIDTLFNGYLIPTEATIVADMDSVNQDKELWKDPELFQPQRFIDESGCLSTPEYFVSFFIGTVCFTNLFSGCFLGPDTYGFCLIFTAGPDRIWFCLIPVSGVGFFLQ